MIPPPIAAVIGAALVLSALPADAALRIRLDSGVADRCPDPETIIERWRARSSSDAAVELHVVPVAGRLLGVVRAAPEGSPPAARRLRAERDACAALVDALLTSAALLTATIELPAPPPTAEPAASSDPDGPRQADAVAADGPDRPSASESITPRTLDDGGGPWRMVLGLRSDYGAAPSAMFAGELGLAHRWPSISVGGALHGGVTPTSTVGVGQVSVERYAAAVHGCWHPWQVALCGLARSGIVALRPSALDGADVTEPMVDAGLRVAWRLGLGEGWGLVVDAEVTAPLRRLRLNIDGDPTWLAAPVAGGGGVAVQWAP